MRASIACAVIGLTLLAGCGTAQDDQVTVARAVKPAGSAAASPTPTVERATLISRSRAAMPKPDAYAGFGVPAKAETEKYDNNQATAQVCNLAIIGESSLTHVSNVMTWEAPGLFLIQRTHGYTTLSGKDVVEAVRRNAANCTTWTERYSDGDIDFTFLEPYDPGSRAAGTDAGYGRCDTLKFKTGGDAVYCDAYLAKGPLVTHLAVAYGESVQESRAKLNELLPAAVALLVAA